MVETGMKREVTLDEISDGKLYDSNDMVKAGCGGCRGCSACCRGMGQSIVLDPLDVFWLTAGFGCTMEALLGNQLELNVVDGIILPNLRMAEPSLACAFLDGGGRCSIHAFRPGICRLFPLGRYYENHSFHYFLQIHECSHTNRTKVKVSKWVEMPELKTYERFVCDWHYFLLELQQMIQKKGDSGFAKEVSMGLLKYFFLTPYDENRSFYEQFYQRLKDYSWQ